jgi:hypothetical protein
MAIYAGRGRAITLRYPRALLAGARQGKLSRASEAE